MNSLHEALLEVGVEAISAFPTMEKEWLLFCEQNEPLFEHVTSNKPDKPVVNHLLGILTKSHIELAALLTEHTESIQAMQSSFTESLGTELAQKFENSSANQFVLITHLWLYVQGHLSMDFSLANDHADNSASLLTSITQADQQTLRTGFLESYYKGKERSPLKPTKNALFNWIKSLFS